MVKSTQSSCIAQQALLFLKSGGYVTVPIKSMMRRSLTLGLSINMTDATIQT